MAIPTPEQAGEKWGRRLSGATEDIRRGVAAVTVSPTEQAADAQDKMLARVTESIQNGKWARGLRRVSLNDWKEATLNKGIPRLATGVAAGTPKMVEFMRDFLPHVERVQAQVRAMPDLTLEDNIARATAAIRGMAAFERS